MARVLARIRGSIYTASGGPWPHLIIVNGERPQLLSGHYQARAQAQAVHRGAFPQC